MKRVLTNIAGRLKEELQELVYSVFCLCAKYQIALERRWLPRDQNQIADTISHIIDTDDWQLNPEVFKSIDDMWGLTLLIVLLQHILCSWSILIAVLQR